MSGQARHFYAFGHFRLYPGEYLLARDGQAVPLPPRVFDTLALLVENGGHLIEKEELMKQLWPDAFVEEANLTNNISMLRKALGETADEHYIETVPRRGYRFVVPVRLEQEESAVSLPADSSNPPGVSSRRKPGRAMLAVFALALAAVVSLAYWWPPWRFGGEAKPAEVIPVKPGIKSIAVLPFKPLDSDGRDEYLGLGMADTLITKLSGLRSLIVAQASASA